MKVDFSNFFRLNLQDALKGVLVAAITVIVGGLTTWFTSDPIHFPTGAEFITLLKAGGLAGIAYLLKNLFTPAPDTVVIDPKKTDVVRK